MGGTDNNKTAISTSIPVFTYEAANFKRHQVSAIRAGDVFVHTIEDANAFREALGYTGTLVQKLTLEEYIWERYVKDGASKSQHCLQVRLNAYLFKHSSEYRRIYGDAYDSCQPLQPLKK